HSGHPFLAVFLAFVPSQPAWGDPPDQEGKEAVPAGAQVRTDRHGDPLPAGAVARLGTLRFRLYGKCTLHGFSPDGKAVLLTGADGGLHWMDARTGKKSPWAGVPAVQALAPGERVQVMSVLLAGDSRTAALRGNFDDIVLVDVPSGKQRGRIAAELLSLLIHPAEAVNSSAHLAPDGRLVAVRVKIVSKGKEEEVITWIDAVRGRLLHRVSGRHRTAIGHVCFTQDGRTLAALEQDGGLGKSWLRTWDVASGREVRNVELAEPVSGEFHFLPDGTALVARDDGGSVLLLEAASGKVLRRFP